MFQKSFKALMVWRLVADSQRLTQDIEELNASLAERPAAHPPESMRIKTGFVRPFGSLSQPGVYAEPVGKDAWLIAHTTCERRVPSKAFKQAVNRQLEKRESETGERATARDRAQVKELVYEEMLPHAFVEENTVYAVLTRRHIYLGVNSAKVGEKVLDDLRSVLGSLKVIPGQAEEPPIAAFTRWFNQGHVSHIDALGTERKLDALSLGQRFVIEDPETRSKIRGTWEHLYDADFVNWVEHTGARVLTLGLTWRDTEVLESDTGVSFTLTEMLGIRGIKWPGDVLDASRNDLGSYSHEDLDSEDEDLRARAEVESDAILFAHLLRSIWRTVTNALGGEQAPNEPDEFEDPEPALDDDEDDLI